MVRQVSETATGGQRRASVPCAWNYTWFLRAEFKEEQQVLLTLPCVERTKGVKLSLPPSLKSIYLMLCIRCELAGLHRKAWVRLKTGPADLPFPWDWDVLSVGPSAAWLLPLRLPHSTYVWNQCPQHLIFNCNVLRWQRVVLSLSPTLSLQSWHVVSMQNGLTCYTTALVLRARRIWTPHFTLHSDNRGETRV